MAQHAEYRGYNTNLIDYLGNYRDGDTLSDIRFTQPPESAANSILEKTTEERPNLRVGSAAVSRETPNTVEIRLSARYKPADETDYETDQWGYTETGLLPALRITDLTEAEADLIEAFVPVAVDKADGFAGFRATATKTNSLVDRLKTLTLPLKDDVRDGLESYIETKQRADELEQQILRRESLIDEIVCELFGVADDEVDLVNKAVDTLEPSLRSQSD